MMDVEAIDREGQEHESSNRIDEAIVICNRIIETNPSFEGSWYKNEETLARLVKKQSLLAEAKAGQTTIEELLTLGKGFVELSMDDRAADCYDKIVKMDPKYAEVLKSRYFVDPDVDKGQPTVIDKAIALDPSDARLWKKKGDNLERWYRDAAVTCYDKAIALDVDNIYYGYLYFSKGRCLNRWGKYKEAIVAFDKALEISPDGWTTLKMKGDSLAKLGQFEKAIECYDRILQLHPDDSSALNAKAKAREQQGQMQEALAAYDKAVAADPSNRSAWLTRAKFLFSIGRNQEGDESLNNGVSFSANNPYTWKEKGRALDEWGYHEDAIPCFDKGLKLDPKDWDLWQAKADAHMKAGHFREAATAYAKAAQYEQKIRYFAWKQANALYRLGALEEAIACLDKTVTSDSSNATAWYIKGVYHLIQGQIEQANISFDMALKEDFFTIRSLKEDTPGNPKIQLEQALQFFDANVESKPSDPKFWIKRGIVLHIAGKSTEAQFNFEKAIQLQPKYAKVWSE